MCNRHRHRTDVAQAVLQVARYFLYSRNSLNIREYKPNLVSLNKTPKYSVSLSAASPSIWGRAKSKASNSRVCCSRFDFVPMESIGTALSETSFLSYLSAYGGLRSAKRVLYISVGLRLTPDVRQGRASRESISSFFGDLPGEKLSVPTGVPSLLLQCPAVES